MFSSNKCVCVDHAKGRTSLSYVQPEAENDGANPMWFLDFCGDFAVVPVRHSDNMAI